MLPWCTISKVLDARVQLFPSWLVSETLGPFPWEREPDIPRALSTLFHCPSLPHWPPVRVPVTLCSVLSLKEQEQSLLPSVSICAGARAACSHSGAGHAWVEGSIVSLFGQWELKYLLFVIKKFLQANFLIPSILQFLPASKHYKNRTAYLKTLNLKTLDMEVKVSSLSNFQFMKGYNFRALAQCPCSCWAAWALLKIEK